MTTLSSALPRATFCEAGFRDGGPTEMQSAGWLLDAGVEVDDIDGGAQICGGNSVRSGDPTRPK